MKMKKNFVNFPQKLKLDRQQLGLNQTELANLLGVQPSYISRLESGDGNPSPALVRLLASHTGNSYEYYRIEEIKKDGEKLFTINRIVIQFQNDLTVENQVSIKIIEETLQNILSNAGIQEATQLLHSISLALRAKDIQGHEEEKVQLCKQQSDEILRILSHIISH